MAKRITDQDDGYPQYELRGFKWLHSYHVATPTEIAKNGQSLR